MSRRREQWRGDDGALELGTAEVTLQWDCPTPPWVQPACGGGRRGGSGQAGNRLIPWGQTGCARTCFAFLCCSEEETQRRDNSHIRSLNSRCSSATSDPTPGTQESARLAGSSFLCSLECWNSDGGTTPPALPGHGSPSCFSARKHPLGPPTGGSRQRGVQTRASTAKLKREQVAHRDQRFQSASNPAG